MRHTTTRPPKLDDSHPGYPGGPADSVPSSYRSDSRGHNQTARIRCRHEGDDSRAASAQPVNRNTISRTTDFIPRLPHPACDQPLGVEKTEPHASHVERIEGSGHECQKGHPVQHPENLAIGCPLLSWRVHALDDLKTPNACRLGETVLKRFHRVPPACTSSLVRLSKLRHLSNLK